MEKFISDYDLSENDYIKKYTAEFKSEAQPVVDFLRMRYKWMHGEDGVDIKLMVQLHKEFLKAIRSDEPA